VPVWQNQQPGEHFLYGWGVRTLEEERLHWSTSATRSTGSGKVYPLKSQLGPPIATWSAYAVEKALGTGTYRLQGSTESGCTSRAGKQGGSTAFYEAVSNEVQSWPSQMPVRAARAAARTPAPGVCRMASHWFTTADGHLCATWQNRASEHFLYGCGSADLWPKNGSDWGKLKPWRCLRLGGRFSGGRTGAPTPILLSCMVLRR